ncbi:hypothetical protein MAR_013311 [Mya arenaria]|uniref:Uncharacterized protein n=1 Tax=Mya arenaria TaxID=6604 RepID=A0ABY7FZJ4_MYAAR|nr:hypothetical protein MAR_013311 [Mya arenaria]
MCLLIVSLFNHCVGRFISFRTSVNLTYCTMGHKIIIVMVALSTLPLVTGQLPDKPKLMECKSCNDCDDYLPDGSAVECSGSCFTYKVYKKGCLTSGGITMKWDQEGCYNMDVSSYIGEIG